MRLCRLLLVLVAFNVLVQSDLSSIDVVELAQPRAAQATPTLSGAKAFDALNGDFSGVGLGQVGALINSDMETASVSNVGTPPANHDFETGTLANWTGGSGTSVVGSPGSYTGRVGGSGTLVSSAFTVDSAADLIDVQISTSGGHIFQINILYGATYSSKAQKTFSCSSSCPTGWRTLSRDVAPFRGQSIKIEIYRATGSAVLVDDAGVGKTISPGWVPTDGEKFSIKSGGPTGNYAEMTSLEDAVSSAITVDDDAQNMTVDLQVVNGIASVVLLSGTGYSTTTTLATYTTANAGSWSTKTFGIGDYTGQSVKLKLVTASSTTLRWDNAGLFSNVIPGWKVTGSRVAELGSATADWLESEPFTIPYGNTTFRICGTFREAFNGAGVNGGTAMFVYFDGNLVFSWGDFNNVSKEDEFVVGALSETTSTFRIHLTAGAVTDVRPSLNCLERLDPPPGVTSPPPPPPGQLYDPRIYEKMAKRTTAASPDPVDLITGNFTHEHQDLAIPGKGIPLSFSRTYSAQSLPDPILGSPMGTKWSHSWMSSLQEIDADHALIRVPGGGKYYFSKSGSVYVPSAGVEASLVKNGGGDWTLTTPDQVQYNFSSTGKLTSLLDRNGYTTSLTYDGNGRLTTVTDASSRTLTLAYNGSGQISSVTDPLSRMVSFTYTNGDLTSVTDVNGGVTDYEYTRHLLTKGTDSNNNNFVRNTYDSFARVASQLDATNGQTLFAYSTPGDGATRMTDARGNETTYYFDTSYRITDVEDDNGGVTSMVWDSDNNKTCVTDPLGNRTGFAYDSAGNLTGLIDADNTNSSCTLKSGGVQWTFTYTSTNEVDLATDPLGRQTDYVYDGNGNLTEVVRKDGSSNVKLRTCFTVPTSGTTKGLVTEIIESITLSSCTGNKRLLEYDSYGNVTAVVDPRFSSAGSPPKAQMTYDLAGRLLTATNELGHTTTYTYDPRGMRLTAEDELGNTTTNTYDDKGLLLDVEDANLNMTTYQYDAADRLVLVEDAEGGVTTYSYDENGNRIAVTNANREAIGAPETGADCGAPGTGDGTDDDSDSAIDDGCPSTIYAYDNLDRLVSETDALGNVREYDYDVASRLYTRTDARSLVTTYGYDSRNNLTSIDYPSGTTDVSFSYNAMSMRTQMVDGTGTTTYDYDALDRLTAVTFPGSRTVAYGYDNVGNRASITYPGGSDSVDYEYDEANNLVSVTDWNSKETTYDYDDAGILTTATLPNGIVSTYGYDNADRLTSITHKLGLTTVKAVGYTLDDAGMRTERVDGLGTHTYDYDNLYRLTGVTYPGPTTDTYTYDQIGNRLSKNATNYTYDAAERLTSVGAVSYGYDDNGNLTSRGVDSYVWDAENRLTSATVSSTTTTFAYRGDGLRDSLTANSVTTTFTWDTAVSVPQVLDDGDLRYVYGLGRIAQVESDGTMHYYLDDALGSVMALTDDAGAVENAYEYDVFGGVRASSGSVENQFGFTGEQTDDSTELQYLRTRYFDPESGTFLSRDSMAHSPSWEEHPYSYVESNPVNYIDPLGRARRPRPQPSEDAGQCEATWERCIESGERAMGRTGMRRWEVAELCDSFLRRCQHSVEEGKPFDWNRELRKWFRHSGKKGFTIQFTSPRGFSIPGLPTPPNSSPPSKPGCFLGFICPPNTGEGPSNARILPNKEGNVSRCE